MAPPHNYHHEEEPSVGASASLFLNQYVKAGYHFAFVAINVPERELHTYPGSQLTAINKWRRWQEERDPYSAGDRERRSIVPDHFSWILIYGSSGWVKQRCSTSAIEADQSGYNSDIACTI